MTETGNRPSEKYFYFVDGVRYESDQEVLTGAQIKARIPNFDNSLVLMLEGTGKEPGLNGEGTGKYKTGERKNLFDHRVSKGQHHPLEWQSGGAG